MNDARQTDRLPDELPPDPMHWADAWLKEAMAADVQRNANTMMIVTVAADGQPSARAVLCKELVPDPGYLVFYTNYRSRKSLEIEANPKVTALFHWDAMGRQIRIEGIAVRSPEAESDDYFATREWGSQLGAWGSDQSEPIASRAALVAQVRERAATLGVQLTDDSTHELAAPAPEIGRPAHWGGIRVWATAIELWLEGQDRIHDRAEWRRRIVRGSEGRFTVTPWSGQRLQP